MASLGSSFIDKRQGKPRVPKPPPPRRNRPNQTASTAQFLALSSTSHAPSSEFNLQSTSASRHEGASFKQSRSTYQDTAPPPHHNASRWREAEISHRDDPAFRHVSSQSGDTQSAQTAPSPLRSTLQETHAHFSDTQKNTAPPDVTSPPRSSDGTVRTLRATRSNTSRVGDGHLLTPLASQVSATMTSRHSSWSKTQEQHGSEGKQSGSCKRQLQGGTAASDNQGDERPAKKPRKIRSDKGRPRGPRASNSHTQENHADSLTVEVTNEQELSETQGRKLRARAARASSERDLPVIPDSSIGQVQQSDTVADTELRSISLRHDIRNGDENSPRPMKRRRRRASTPTEIDPQKLNSGETMMFEFGRDKKTGPVSNLEKAMRGIDWNDVKQKRYEADLREMEEDMARQAAADAEHTPDRELDVDGETDVENPDIEVEIRSPRNQIAPAKRKIRSKGAHTDQRRSGRRTKPTASRRDADESGDEDGAQTQGLQVDKTHGEEGAGDDERADEIEDAAEDADDANDARDNDDMNDTGDTRRARPRNPRLRIINGEIQFDTSSLTVDRQAETAAAAEEAAAEDGDAIEESDLTNRVNSRSFLAERRRDPRERFFMKHKQRGWDEESTAQFYEALRMFGTDFNRISQLFPGRTRMHIKRKFNREERTNPILIDEACLGGKPGGLAYFATAVGRDLGSFKDPKAFMGQLEKEKEEQRETIAREQREKQEEAEKKRDAARERQEERRRRVEEKRSRQKRKTKGRMDNSVEEVLESVEAAEAMEAAAA